MTVEDGSAHTPLPAHSSYSYCVLAHTLTFGHWTLCLGQTKAMQGPRCTAPGVLHRFSVGLCSHLFLGMAGDFTIRKSSRAFCHDGAN